MIKFFLLASCHYKYAKKKKKKVCVMPSSTRELEWNIYSNSFLTPLSS